MLKKSRAAKVSQCASKKVFHGDPEIEQGIPDPSISSGWVLVCHADGDVSDAVSHPGAPGASLGRAVVFVGHKFPEPTQEACPG